MCCRGSILSRIMVLLVITLKMKKLVTALSSTITKCDALKCCFLAFAASLVFFLASTMNTKTFQDYARFETGCCMGCLQARKFVRRYLQQERERYQKTSGSIKHSSQNWRAFLRINENKQSCFPFCHHKLRQGYHCHMPN